MNLTISPVMGITPKHRIAFGSDMGDGDGYKSKRDSSSIADDDKSHKPVPYDIYVRDVKLAEDQGVRSGVMVMLPVVAAASLIALMTTQCSDAAKTTQFAEQTDSVLKANTINDTLKNVKFNDVDGDGVIDMEIFNPNDGKTTVVDFAKQQVLQQKTSLEPIK